MRDLIKGNIIYIEDDKLDQISFMNFIEEYELEYDCTIADSLKDAKKFLNKKHYDIALIDYKLTDGTAFDVIEKMKETPFIILTGVGDESIATQAMKRGAYDYIIKDLRGSYLKSLPMIIENTIKRKQMEEELKNYQANLEVMVKERTEQLKNEIDEHEKAVEKTLLHKKVLEENVKESRCFFEILKITEDPNASLNDKLEKIVKALPNAFQNPKITCIRMKYNNFIFLSDNFKETQNMLKRDLIIHNIIKGIIEVYLINENTVIDDDLFLESEIFFFDSFSKYLMNLIINYENTTSNHEDSKKYKNKFKNIKDQIKDLNKKNIKVFNSMSDVYFEAKGYLEKITEDCSKNELHKGKMIYLENLRGNLNSFFNYINNLETYSKEISAIIKQNNIKK